jgi:AcrR family transcriptional regulator
LAEHFDQEARMAQDTGPKPKGESAADPRARIIGALMELAAERAFEEITISEICAKASVSLADFREAFPSKGAVLAGFSKRIDRIVLQQPTDELASEEPKERLFDVLMRRLEAMTPYRDGLREVAQWLRREPLAALAVNQATVNSMRFMLEAAGIGSEGGAGAVKLQGLALAWARIVDVWLDDEEPELSRTMAALDRELSRGERLVAQVERFDRFAGPLKALARAALETRKRAAESFRPRARRGDAGPDRHEQRT